MDNKFISWKKAYILGILSLFLLSSCKVKENVQTVAVKKKINKVHTMIKSLENKTTFPRIPEYLLEPVIYLPSWEEAKIKALNRKISITAIDTPLKDILDLISRATSLDVIYIQKDKKTNLENKKVSIKVKNKKIKDILDILSKVANFHYKIEKGAIIISNLQTKIYDVGIPKISSQSNIAINGNIFGSAQTNITVLSNLKNSYMDIQTKNPYKDLENALKKFLSKDGKYYLNEDTGTLVVTDYPENIKKIDNIVQKFKYFYSKQIDVKITILEYSKSATDSKGISWQTALTKLLDNLKLSYQPINEINDNNGFIISGFSIGTGPKIEKIIFNYLSRFGKTKILSSPRIRLTNGYSAIIVSGEVRPYWLRTLANTNENGTSSYVWKAQNFINGYVLVLKARVNEQNQIYLVLTPVKNSIIGVISSPDKSQAPIISTSVISTILKLNDGDIVVMGGLKSIQTNEEKEGIPGIKDKLLDALTSAKSSNVEDKEIIMIIRAKLVY